MKKRIGVTLVIVAGLASGLPHVANADPAPAAPAGSKPNATVLFSAGESKYKAADYAGALADFSAADSQTPSVEAARYIGLCEDKLGHLRLAAVAYNRFLAHPPSKLVDEVGPIVVRVREIEQTPGTVRIETNPQGATITIDGAPEKLAAPYEAQLAPGKHIVRATAADHEALEREVNVTFASSQSVSLSLAEAAIAAPPPPSPAPTPPPAPLVTPTVTPAPPPAITRRTVAFAAAGFAVVGAGLAATFGALALHNKSEYGRNPTIDNADKGNNDAAYCDGGIALAAAAGVVSLVLFLTDEDGSRPSPASTPAHSTGVAASPFVTPHGGGAGVLLHF